MQGIERLFEPRLAFLACLAIAASQYAVFVMALSGLSAEYTFGGDFAAFWAAARETLNGNMVSLYDASAFEAAIQAHSPHDDLEGLTWQYPPHATLLYSPIGLLPFPIAYAVWCAAGLSVFALALASIGLKQRMLIASVATVPVLLAINTGQTGLFTAALLLIAVFNAKTRPIVAGLAAALLTIKPQLGFLLPVLFLASGSWRAFGIAALATLTLIGLSVGVLGLEAWIAFFDSVRSVSGSVATGLMPLFKMVNVYAASRLLGSPEIIVFGLSAAMIVGAVVATVWVARSSEDPKWHYATIACMTLLAAPYSYYYDLALIVPAVISVLQSGHQKGWLPFEREMVGLAVLMTLALPGPAVRSGVSLCFVFMLMVAAIVARRAFAIHRVNSENSPKPKSAAIEAV